MWRLKMIEDFAMNMGNTDKMYNGEINFNVRVKNSQYSLIDYNLIKKRIKNFGKLN